MCVYAYHGFLLASWVLQGLGGRAQAQSTCERRTESPIQDSMLHRMEKKVENYLGAICSLKWVPQPR